MFAAEVTMSGNAVQSVVEELVEKPEDKIVEQAVQFEKSVESVSYNSVVNEASTVTASGQCGDNLTWTLEDGTLAGSNTNLMKCMVTAVKEMNVPLEVAVGCAAVNSAKSVGIYDQYGSITPGKVANAVLLNKEDLSVKQVILKGKCI